MYMSVVLINDLLGESAIEISYTSQELADASATISQLKANCENFWRSSGIQAPSGHWLSDACGRL
jgi:hypothetical protein